jgi:polysaccharide pyruvyl transferase CsaB
MKCLLIGNYGVGNIGDEALREYFLSTFPQVDWIVVSAHPTGSNEVPRLPGGVRSLFSGWGRTIKAIKQSDAVVFGGGSLFTDVESVYACFLWFLHAFAASYYRKPIYLAFQGIGPFQTGVGEWLARSTVQKAAFISVRDQASEQRARRWGLNKNIILTADPAFALFKSKKSDNNPKNVFIIIPRHNSSKTFISIALELHKKHYFSLPVHALLMQPDEAGEQGIADDLTQQMGDSVTVVRATTTDILMKEVSTATHVVTQRFHGGIAALAAGVPMTVVPQRDGDKLSELQAYASGQASVASIQSAIDAGEKALKDALKA